MWTPKRVLLLMLGFAVFFTAYLVYANVLGFGGIDGLPPLPEEFWPSPRGTELEPLPTRPNDADKKLLLAFGDDETIKNAPIKLEIRSRGLVLAAEHIECQDDGRVKLCPFYVAIFGKDRGDNQFPEINTIRSREAWLEFDRPVHHITEMGGRKLIGGELRGDIIVVNNRRTPNQDDDLSLLTQGPLHYAESKHMIWTKAEVRILDPKPKPEPTTITATGMDVYLTVEEAPPAGSAPAHPKKAKSENISGVDRIRLRADVDMKLWMDARSGFLGSGDAGKKSKPPANQRAATAAVGKKEPAKPAEDKPAAEEMAKVTIQTPGSFVYDLRTDRATYDIAQRQGATANSVIVNRINEKEGKYDQLVCDHLDLQFQRKAGADAHGAADRSENLEIEKAHATGTNVALSSDSELLHAFGTDLYYDARNKVSILKGEPEMVAAKEGNFIHARELRMRSDPQGGQQATARGPGFIEMLDRTSAQRPLLARWKDELVFGKDGNYDLLVLTGDASFEDKEHGQQMYGDTLKVWLEPSDSKKPAAGDDQQKRLPHHVEAIGHVRTVSADMRVHDSERLVLWFHDVAAADMPTAPTPATKTAAGSKEPAPAPAGGSAPAVPSVGPELPLPDKAVAGAAEKPAKPVDGNTAAAAPGKAAPTADATKPKKPMDLSARSIEAHVLRCAGKNDLDKLSCEGSVRVLQDPATPEEKGIDIRGDTLQLKHRAEGNELTVTGEFAQVQLEQLFIVGPEVNIHQTTNKAWVNGIGAMRLPSNTNFEGAKLNKPGEMIVHWKQAMYFDGKTAWFYGGTQAEQDNARLLCQTLQVFLDRFVSFREGQKGGQQAKVEKLVCDKNVRIEDTTRDERGRLLTFKRIDSKELSLDNEDGIVVAPGPGTVRILQPGTKGEIVPQTKPGAPAANGATSKPGGASGAPANSSAHRGQPGTKPAAKDDEEIKLTRVTYQGRMHANNNNRTATFYDDVELVNVPTENPDLPIDLDRLPPGALYLRCQLLKVFTHREPDGKTSQEMEAHRKVVVQSQEFWAVAEVVKYDEREEKIIFEGGEGGMAHLVKVAVRGAPSEDVVGRQITYWRQTGEWRVVGGRGMKVGN